MLIRLIAGDSGSFARYRLVVVTQFIALTLFGASLAVHLNARLDRSPPVVSRGTVGEAMQQTHSRGALGFEWGTWPALT